MNKAKILLVIIFILFLPITITTIILIAALFVLYRLSYYVKTTLTKENVSSNVDINEEETVLCEACS